MSTALAQSTGIETLIKAQAYGLGFDLVGITSLGPMQTAPEFEAWLAARPELENAKWLLT
jgi:hypothetical protein